MSGGNELLPVGQYGNYKKLVETATSSVVAEMTAAWLQPSTESIGLLAASTAVIGHVIADTSTAVIGLINLVSSGGDQYQFNHAVTLLASTSRTTNTASADQTNYNSRAHIVQVLYDTSTGSSITPTLQVKDSISDSYKTVWTAASAISSTGHYAYLFDVGGVGSAGSYTEAVNLRLARTWRLNMTHTSSGATQYSASCDNLL